MIVPVRNWYGEQIAWLDVEPIPRHMESFIWVFDDEWYLLPRSALGRLFDKRTWWRRLRGKLRSFVHRRWVPIRMRWLIR